MSRFISRLCAAAAVLTLIVPVAASAEDWASSLYTEGGAELRVDERVFTLFAALNELGLDDAPLIRKDPVPRYDYDPVRQQVRDDINIDAAMRVKFQDFLDKHPAPLRTYTAFALAVGPAPTFKIDGQLPKELEGLKGFEALLAEFYAKNNVKNVFGKVMQAQRDTLKTYATAVDAPITEARKIMKTPETDESPRIVVVVNLLDGRGSSYGIGAGDETYLVVGPSGGKPDAGSVVRAFARVELQQAAEKGESLLKNGKALLSEVKSAGYLVGADSVADYVAESMARVIAVKAAVPDAESESAMAAERRKGFVLVGEMNRGLAIFAKSPKPMNQFLGDFLREVDTGKAAAALRGN